MSRQLAKALVLALAAVVIAACTNGTQNSSSGNKFSGVTVRVLTFTGPQIAEPLQRRGPDFERQTGAKIEVITVPFSDLYQKLLTDFATKTNSYDAMVFDPQWMGDYVPPGYLEDLGGRIKNDSAIQWNDIAPFFRDFSATFKGKIYTIPLDGDFQMVYYRTDLLQKDGLQPPQTWDDFFSTANMEPLMNNPAMAKALGIYKTLSKLGPADQLNNDVGDSRGLFVTGRCALSLDWGDIGPLAVDKTQSKVQDKVGAVILPGSKQVLDRSTGRLVDCNSTICPYAINGVNHSPFAAFGGWSGAINKAASSKVKDAAYAFLSYMSQPAQSSVDVTIGKTGFNPYRTSHFTNMGPWLASGMSQQAAKDYLGAIEASLKSPNMVLDLRIPQSAFYEGTALDTALAQYLAGELTAVQTMAQITAQWNKKTDEIGRQSQLDAYRSSLSVTK